MVRYCQSCGRAAPNDAVLCPYCGVQIDQSKSPVILDQKPARKDNKIIIIVAIVVILLVAIPAIAATVYVYVSGMVGEPDIEVLPNLFFIKDDIANTLTAANVEPATLRWNEIEITADSGGSFNTDGLLDNSYIKAGDQITDCSGTITIIHKPTNSILGVWTFE